MARIPGLSFGVNMKNEPISPIGNITPYPFQFEVVEAVKDHIRNEWRSFDKSKIVKPAFVEAYVSAGKTIMIGAVANHVTKAGGRTLILSRTSELVEQNSDECWNMDTKNSIFSASLGIKSKHYPVVVGTEGTVSNAINKQLDGWWPHVILIDECHEVCWRTVVELMKDPAYETKNQYAKVITSMIKRYPKVAIIGFTGTPFRGVESIKGPFWSDRVGPRVSREFLVDNGYIVPTVFGKNNVEYDFHEFDGTAKADGTEDYSAEDLRKMGDMADKSITAKIMEQVKEIGKTRGGMLITCASEKHCKEAASHLPAGEWVIITAKTNKNVRREALKKAAKGKIKYCLQIGCLTTGVNVPYWDTSIIMRRIGSLTLLIQLLGRGMRLPKGWMLSLDNVKSDHAVYDFSGTMENMYQMYDHPILADADMEKTKRKNLDPKKCPICKHKNGFYARRCSNLINGIRCEHFWVSKLCPKKGCGVKNDPGANECRSCGGIMIDPNEALSGKHYTMDDWKKVNDMSITPTKNGGVFVQIFFDTEIDGRPEVAKLFFSPFSSQGARRIWQQTFVNRFVEGWPARRKIGGLKNIEGIMKNKHLFRVPSKATHRINAKGRSVVNGVDFTKDEDDVQVD